METRSSPLLRMESITKSYAGVAANDHIDFDVSEGEIHALLGENGAGKTTLMRILYGMSSPDSGKIWWKGEEVSVASSRVAIQLGIGMVHQHFMLIPELTVVENVVLGLDTGKSPLLHLKQPAAHLQELSARFGLKVDPWARLKDLSTGERQRVEIMKTLYRGAHLLVLDEPTAVLTPGEVTELFHVLRSLRAEGHALVLITHKLNEVIELSDRVTVLRRGRSIATLKTSDSSREHLATLMVGRPVILQVDKRPPDPGREVIRIEQATIQDREHHYEIQNVSLGVREGEVVAITGVAGNGQRPLVDALFGLRRLTSGRIFVAGKEIANCRPRDLVVLNVGRIPEDRQTMGLALPLSVCENLALETYNQEPYCRRGILRHGQIRALAQRLVAEYDIRTPSITLPAASLSGGNQQKLILARALHRKPRVLIAFDPTRGLDVGATEFIYKLILSARDQGVAVLLISTDLEEVLCLSDQIAVIYNGQIMGVLPTAEASEGQLGLMMAGTRLADVRGAAN